MANVMNKYLPKRIATTFTELKHRISCLQRTASSITFIEQAIYHNITPTFEKVKGQFLKEEDRKTAEVKLMKDHLHEHKGNIMHLIMEQRKLYD